MRTLKFQFMAWATLLGLYAFGWIAWQDDRATATLFLAWSAVGIPLYAFSPDLRSGQQPSPRWLLLVILIMWMDAVTRAVSAFNGQEFSHLGLTITIGPALISLVAIVQLGQRWRFNSRAPAPEGT